MNMFLHSFDSARVEWCDTLNSPLLVENDRLMKFNCVVANPPFSLDKWGAENAESDPYNRFWRGMPPQVKEIGPLSATWWKPPLKSKDGSPWWFPMACCSGAQPKAESVRK